MTDCAICKLQRHTGSCVSALLAEVVRLHNQHEHETTELRNQYQQEVAQLQAQLLVAQQPRKPLRDRAAYFREYRRRP